MIKLYELGINEKDIKNMLEVCPDIENLTDLEISNKINILESLKCQETEIRNIVTANPNFLLRVDRDILNLIKKLYSLGIERVDITIDTNPWILNKDVFEIEDYIKEKQKAGLEMEDIIDLIDSGMMED